MSRIQPTFAKLRERDRKALVTFIMGGDADMAACEALLAGLPEAGADVIEIGMPFSDPMADGPVIQAAGLRALKAGTKMRDILALVSRFRAGNNTTPLVLMGYYNPLYRYGVEAFCRDAASAGVDGLIIVDLPPEEEAELKPYAEAAGLDFIRLLAPPSLGARLPMLTETASGFLYFISVAGVTGAKSADMGQLATQASAIRAQTSLPLAIGFGVKTPEQARDTAAHGDAVVVGSALVDVFHREGKDAALGFVRALRAGLNN